MVDEREGRSRTVAILGASVLGGALAHKLAGRDRVDEIRLVDPNAKVAAGMALDIQQAGSIEGYRTRVVSAGDVQAAAGAAVIVLAGFARPTAPYEDEEDKKDQGKAEYALLKQVAQLDSDAVLVCADASHRPLIERGVREMKIPRARVIGSAPGALASALRALVALEVGGSPSQVALTVLGTPPHHTVISWSDATARGQALTQLLEPPRLTRLKARVPYLWPPGPYTLASAASRVCEAIVVGGSTCAFSCFVGLDRELVSRVGNPLTFSGRGIPYGFVAPSSDIPEMIGRHAVPAERRAPENLSPDFRLGTLGAYHVVSALSVVLGPQGVTRILTPSLSVHERVELENALAAT